MKNLVEVISVTSIMLSTALMECGHLLLLSIKHFKVTVAIFMS